MATITISIVGAIVGGIIGGVVFFMVNNRKYLMPKHLVYHVLFIILSITALLLIAREQLAWGFGAFVAALFVLITLL